MYKSLIRGYYYYQGLFDAHVPEIMFGLYVPKEYQFNDFEDTTGGEMAMRWEILTGMEGDTYHAKLVVFRDAFPLLPKFADVFERLSDFDGGHITEQEFLEVLQECGFKNLTDQ